MGPFSDREVATLTALCDVIVPAVRPPATADETAQRFFALTASEAGTARRVRALLPELLTEQELGELSTLLRVLGLAGIGVLPWQAAQGVLRGLAAADDDAAEALDALRGLTRLLHYGGADETPDGTIWHQLGYPGPPQTPVRPSEPLPISRPPAATDEWHLQADVVVVGSGAGGGVVAARLAAAGQDVLVLEAGAADTEPDFPDDEVTALRRLYWRGGITQTEEGHVTVLAGSTLGGGTTVNWSNCVRPPDHVRSEWADEFGLDGLDGAEFDGHLAAILQRIGATDEHTEVNGPNQRLLEGAKALGWQATTTTRNVDPALEDPRTTGHTGFGDRSGAKLGSLRTWLPDAAGHSARLVTDCAVDRVLVDAHGRAAGVVGWWDDGTRRVRVTASAPTVVLAAGALETPAILLRSAIGGPAVGRHLRLHPVPTMAGVYDRSQRAWSGPPQGVVVDEHAATFPGGHGYLLECPHWHPGLVAAGTTWPDARDHKLLMGRMARMALFIAVTRDRGSGTVTLDEHGRSRVRYPLDDDLDRRMLAQAIRDMVHLHVAAGAQVVLDPGPGRLVWQRGDDVGAFADALAKAPITQRTLFSAHQMGSARMGPDPRTAVADPDGQLHDVPGVWIGDASAFPTAVGSNPMITVMALAHRTADRILDRQRGPA